jgi:NAD(P)-dependent dehydrogenase (short-subunit alcohol dehydrogenase family)
MERRLPTPFASSLVHWYSDVKLALDNVASRLNSSLRWPHIRASWAISSQVAGAVPATSSPSAVNVTAGVRPKGSSIPYAASKAALDHVTKLLAAALGPEVRVNAVAPGLVDTQMTKDWETAQILWAEQSPMRRSAQPADVADMVASLLANTYVTGEIVVLDGGLNLR